MAINVTVFALQFLTKDKLLLWGAKVGPTYPRLLVLSSESGLPTDPAHIVCPGNEAHRRRAARLLMWSGILIAPSHVSASTCHYLAAPSERDCHKDGRACKTWWQRGKEGT